MKILHTLVLTILVFPGHLHCPLHADVSDQYKWREIHSAHGKLLTPSVTPVFAGVCSSTSGSRVVA